MNTDAHVHLVGEGWIEERFFFNLARLISADAGKVTGEFPDPSSLLDTIKDALFETSGEALIREMDAADISRSCLFTVDYGLLTGEPAVSIEQQNRQIADVVRRYPDRFDGFFSIDPRRPGALALFRRGVETWGLRGLKLHPASGWYPYDEDFFPLYQQCQDYQLPLLIHTGGQPAPMKSRFGRPAYVDDVAAAFPQLRIIMAHCGYNWWEEALMICNMKSNCLVDFSGWQQTYLRYPAHFYRVLRQVLDTIGPWRVLFGSDGPYLNVVCPLKNWVGAFRDPQNWPEGITFSDDELDIVMGRAYSRLFDKSQ